MREEQLESTKQNMDTISQMLEKEMGNRAIIDTADFTDLEVLKQNLYDRIRAYHPSEDIHLIKRAYKLAKRAHEGQFRKSGEPYIIHPLSVALILSDLEMDKETIVAGLLHDVVEDTDVTLQQLSQEFSSEVALLVDGVTKLRQRMKYKNDKVEMQAENLRKMFLAMAKDIRVVIIKLADRLHNMRTLKYQPPEKQKDISRETMDIYAPIAQRLGIARVKTELDDLSLRYLQPEVYFDLVSQIRQRQDWRDRYVKDIADQVAQHIEAAGIKAKVKSRVKHLFSIYKKMVNQDKTLDQIYDLFAVRVIVESVKDCYAALGVIHEVYTPIPGRFKDYIAMPKPNMYQSLHTTLIGPSGQPFEVQIRTFEMDKTAEYGIAAHWKYKEASNGRKVDAREEEKLSWLRQILEWQQDLSDNHEFLDMLKSDLDLFSDQVYCFTPTGDVKTLPVGSTPIDFAYAIHSAVGNKMIGARVNNRLVPIEYVIQNGDRIEILTSQNSNGPSRDWLALVKSTQAKSKINQWFKSQFKEENIVKGKDMLVQYCKVKSIDLGKINKSEYQKKVMQKYGFKDWDSVMAALGHGGLKEGQIVNKLQEEYNKANPKVLTDADVLENAGSSSRKTVSSRGGIIVRGVHDVSVHYPKCCNPVPGDEIIGFVTRGRGVSIHRTDCINILSLPDPERERLIEAEWAEPDKNDEKALYSTEIIIYCDNRSGLLADISKILTERNIDITSVNTRTSKQGKATIGMCFDISSKAELDSIITRLMKVDSVIDIERA